MVAGEREEGYHIKISDIIITSFLVCLPSRFIGRGLLGFSLSRVPYACVCVRYILMDRGLETEKNN